MYDFHQNNLVQISWIYFTYLSDTFSKILGGWLDKPFVYHIHPIFDTATLTKVATTKDVPLVRVAFPWRVTMHCGAKQNCCQDHFVLLLIQKRNAILIKQPLLQHLWWCGSGQAKCVVPSPLGVSFCEDEKKQPASNNLVREPSKEHP